MEPTQSGGHLPETLILPRDILKHLFTFLPTHLPVCANVNKAWNACAIAVARELRYSELTNATTSFRSTCFPEYKTNGNTWCIATYGSAIRKLRQFSDSLGDIKNIKSLLELAILASAKKTTFASLMMDCYDKAQKRRPLLSSPVHLKMSDPCWQKKRAIESFSKKLQISVFRSLLEIDAGHRINEQIANLLPAPQGQWELIRMGKDLARVPDAERTLRIVSLVDEQAMKEAIVRMLCKRLATMGRVDEAIDIVDRFYPRDEDTSREADLRLIEIYIYCDRQDEAKDIIGTLGNQNQLFAWARITYIYCKMDRVGEAKQAYENITVTSLKDGIRATCWKKFNIDLDAHAHAG